MLTDTGPLLALLDENDRHHASCVAVARSLPNESLLTTWLCFTEAIYFLGEEGGYRFQERLWQLRRDGTLTLLDLTLAEGDRMDALMAQYQNVRHPAKLTCAAAHHEVCVPPAALLLRDAYPWTPPMPLSLP